MTENVTKGVRKPRRGGITGFRSPLAIRGNLDRENFEYRIVNDYEDGARIAQFQDNDWEIVNKSDIEVGEKKVNKPTPEGTPVQVSVGQGTKAYLMRKPKDWYADDQKAKQAEVDATEQTMKPDGTYGHINIDTGVKR